MVPTLPRSRLFPYTTLFRSVVFANPAARKAKAIAIVANNIQVTRFPGDLLAAFNWGGDIRATDLVLQNTNRDRKSTRLNSSHTVISYAVFCLKKKIHETSQA